MKRKLERGGVFGQWQWSGAELAGRRAVPNSSSVAQTVRQKEVAKLELLRGGNCSGTMHTPPLKILSRWRSMEPKGSFVDDPVLQDYTRECRTFFGGKRKR
jgi:hypothetical protein